MLSKIFKIWNLYLRLLQRGEIFSHSCSIKFLPLIWHTERKEFRFLGVPKSIGKSVITIRIWFNLTRLGKYLFACVVVRSYVREELNEIWLCAQFSDWNLLALQSPLKNLLFKIFFGLKNIPFFFSFFEGKRSSDLLTNFFKILKNVDKFFNKLRFKKRNSVSLIINRKIVDAVFFLSIWLGVILSAFCWIKKDQRE